MPLQLREYQKNDFIALKNIIRKTWRYDEFSSPKTASRLADVFLSSCLTNYTFSRVAVLNGKPVGIILVKDIARHTCPLPNRFRQLRAVLSLYLTKEGRAVSKIFENVTGIDRELLRESGKNYPAELALFVVSPSCRGQGVGKALFQAALDYTGQQKLDEIYLFTDTSCNYGFYEHQGMRRRFHALFYLRLQTNKKPARQRCLHVNRRAVLSNKAPRTRPASFSRAPGAFFAALRLLLCRPLRPHRLSSP